RMVERLIAERPEDAGMREDVRAARQVKRSSIEAHTKAGPGIALANGDDTPQFHRPKVCQHADECQHRGSALEAGLGIYTRTGNKFDEDRQRRGCVRAAAL